MASWSALLLTASVGAAIGWFVRSLCSAAGTADDEIERAMRDRFNRERGGSF